MRASLDTLGARLAAKPVSLTPPIPLGFPKKIGRDFFDLFLGEAARDRGSWDMITELVNQIRAAAGLGQPARVLSADASKALTELGRWAITETTNGVYQAVTCEADWPRRLGLYYAQMRLFSEKYPWGPGAMAAAPTECTFRSFTPPERPVKLQRKGYPTGLVIQAEGDGNTQYEGGPAMAARLGDNLITVRDDGTHGLYGRNDCVTKKVDDYLINGVLPSSRSECPGRPRADVPPDTAAGSGRRSLTRGGSLESRARALVAATSGSADALSGRP